MNGDNWKCRTELLLGSEKSELLKKAHVLVAGLGGVGGYTTEQLCRAGIGRLTLIDNDVIQTSNRNRQLAALISTQGRLKVDVIAERLKDINPKIELEKHATFLNEENLPALFRQSYDFVVDAIDTLTPKVLLLKEAIQSSQRVVSSMGSGGKTDLSKIRVDDIADSHHCKFAYLVRKYLHKYEIYKGITVVYSPESVRRETIVETDGTNNKRSMVGTISYLPAVFGCYCAAEVIKGIIATSS